MGSVIAASIGALVLGTITYAYSAAKHRDPARASLTGVIAAAVMFLAIQGVLRGWLWREQDSVAQRHAAMENVLSIDPVFESLKQFDPEHYQFFHGLLLAKAGQGAESATKLLHQSRYDGTFVSVVEHKFSSASDSALIAYAVALMDAANELLNRDPQLCAHYLHRPPASQLEFSELLSQEVQVADTAALAEIVRTSSTDRMPAPPPSDDYFRVATALRRRLEDKHGSDANVLDVPYADSDQETLCRVSISQLYYILRLRERDAGTMLRYQLRAHG